MNANWESTISDQSADHQHDHEANYQGEGLTISRAAQRLGVSENAIRQRIKRNTIAARKTGGVWQIFLTDQDADHHSDPAPATTRPLADHHIAYQSDYERDHEPIETTYRISPDDLEQAIARTGDKYVSDLEAMFERLDRVYQGRLVEKDETIAAKDETISEIRRRAEQAEQERDALRSRVSELEQHKAHSPGSEQTTPQERPQRPWWAFWIRD